MMFFKEPTLDDILSEDAVRLLMARDRVDADDIRALMRRLRKAGEERPPYLDGGSAAASAS